MDKFNSSGDPVVGIISGTIPPSSLTFTNTDRLAGRDTSPGGAGEEIAVGGGVEFTGSGGIQRSALTGDVTASAGSGTTAIATDAVTTAKILDANVTLAKMADLAQDLFIGRTTASTGVPQTATITAAARTVLDDTTVAAMVDTLGGASSTGTGGLVRATSPTLVMPVLGVASATSLTLGTDLPITEGGTGQSTQTAAMDALSPTTTKGDILIDNGTNVIRLGVGLQGQALVSDAAATNGALWAVPAFVPYGRRVSMWLPDPGLATASTVGMIAPTTEGTLGAAPTNAAGAALEFVTNPTLTSGVSCGFYTAFGITQGRWFYDVEWVWRSTGYTNKRTWVGLFSADPATISSPTGIDCVGLRFDDSVDTSTQFRAVTSDVSGTPTVVTLDGTSGNGTFNWGVNTTMRLRIRINAAGSAEFYSDGVLMTTIATTLPQTSDPLGIAFRQYSLSAVTSTLRLFRLCWAQNP